jgi:thiosulfate/3-mercaptopyruvate sulfurtransferase
VANYSSHPGVLVSTDWLAQNLNERQIRIVEVDVDTAAYDAGHIPGAVAWFAAWALWQLKIYQHQDVRLLNGGRKKWLTESCEITRDAPQYAAAEYPGRMAPV